MKEVVKTVKGKDGQDSTVYTLFRVPTEYGIGKTFERTSLLLVPGDMDKKCIPANALRVADALIKAKKNFEMIVLPGNGHGFLGKGRCSFEREIVVSFCEIFVRGREYDGRW